MNYGSQLKGWAIDRATALKCVNKEDATVEDITKAAQVLVDFCYQPDEDKADLLARLEKLEADEVYVAEMKEAIEMKPASNGVVQ